MNLNGKQIISIIMAILSVLMISTTQLTDLFGPALAKTIVSASGLVNTILGGILAAITSQSNQIKDVAAMPGVERIEVNKNANQTLAALAVDKTVDKVAPTASAVDEVLKTAKG